MQRSGLGLASPLGPAPGPTAREALQWTCPTAARPPTRGGHGIGGLKGRPAGSRRCSQACPPLEGAPASAASVSEALGVPTSARSHQPGPPTQSLLHSKAEGAPADAGWAPLGALPEEPGRAPPAWQASGGPPPLRPPSPSPTQGTPDPWTTASQHVPHFPRAQGPGTALGGRGHAWWEAKPTLPKGTGHARDPRWATRSSSETGAPRVTSATRGPAVPPGRGPHAPAVLPRERGRCPEPFPAPLARPWSTRFRSSPRGQPCCHGPGDWRDCPCGR